MHQGLTIQFAAPAAAESKDFVLLEQEPIDYFANYVTKAEAYGWLSSRLFQTPMPDNHCGSADGSFATTIFAYPFPAGLNYRLGASWGLLGERRAALVEMVELVQCDLQKIIRTKYPPSSIDSFDWIGDAYDREGGVVARPDVVISGSELISQRPVYGSLLVTYQVLQHSYPLAISPREDSPGNRLNSFAYVIWPGGNDFLEVKAADGMEGGVCNGSVGGGSSFDYDPSVPDSVPPENETHHIDYCSMECTDCDE